MQAVGGRRGKGAGSRLGGLGLPCVHLLHVFSFKLVLGHRVERASISFVVQDGHDHVLFPVLPGVHACFIDL